jgi:hypothetical protein
MLSRDTAKYRGYARECMRQAEEADEPERRDKLLELVRVWEAAALTFDTDGGNIRALSKARTARPSRYRLIAAKAGSRSVCRIRGILLNLCTGQNRPDLSDRIASHDRRDWRQGMRLVRRQAQ